MNNAIVSKWRELKDKDSSISNYLAQFNDRKKLLSRFIHLFCIRLKLACINVPMYE